MLAHLFIGSVVGGTVGYLGGSPLLAISVCLVVAFVAEWHACNCERRARRRAEEEIASTLL